MWSDILLAFFAALGLAMIIWCLLGLLLLPVFGRDMVTLCYGRGAGRGLEQRVRGFGWLREGRLTGGRLIIVDRGLTEEGRRLARRLCKQYEWVSLYAGEVPAALLAENPEGAGNSI